MLSKAARPKSVRPVSLAGFDPPAAGLIPARLSKAKPVSTTHDQPYPLPGQSCWAFRNDDQMGPLQEQAPTVDWRSREHVQQDIERHAKARRAYGKAVAWEIAAQDQNLPTAQSEEARRQTAETYAELQDSGRRLIICMPTDRRALIDLLIYLEKNFSILPKEMASGDSMALYLLRTMRLSLRKIEK